MKTPRFSVIIPTLNEEKYLPNLLRSLASQTEKQFEVIVVDGQSRDKTVTVARQFGRVLPRLKLIVSKQASLPIQRNLGAKEARGEWLVFVDADSILMPYFMDRVKAFIHEKHPALIATWAQPDSDVVVDAIFTLFFNLIVEASVLFKRPFAPGPLTLVRRDAFKRVGGYNEKRAYNEDVDLGLRLHQRGIPLAIVREALYVWSMRRFRKERKTKVIQQYVVTALPILFFRRPLKFMPGYFMGGHVYDKNNKSIGRDILRQYEKKLRKLMKELFE